MGRFSASTPAHTQTQRFSETANLSGSRGEIFSKARINAALPPSIGPPQSHSRRVTLRCCKCLKFSYDRNMKHANNIAAIDELSASEGVFTTAQAQRLGISRNALSHACKVGPPERVAHGAYRLSGAPSSETDELAAIWKLTASTAFSWSGKLSGTAWPSVALRPHGSWESGASTLPLPHLRSRAHQLKNRVGTFGVRNVDEGDMAWMGGLPVTRAERTLADLCLDCEDPSLVEGAFRDAAAQRPHRLREAWQPARRARRKQTASGPARAPRKSPLRIRPERPIMKSLFLIKHRCTTNRTGDRYGRQIRGDGPEDEDRRRKRGDDRKVRRR